MMRKEKQDAAPRERDATETPDQSAKLPIHPLVSLTCYLQRIHDLDRFLSMKPHIDHLKPSKLEMLFYLEKAKEEIGRIEEQVKADRYATYRDYGV